MIDLDSLSNLPASSPEIKNKWLQNRRWLEDPSMYYKVPPVSTRPRDIRTTRVEAGVLRQLEQHRVISEVPLAKVRGIVKYYTVPEPLKERWRIIQHPPEVNEAYDKTCVPKAVISNKNEIVQLPLIADQLDEPVCFIAVDFKAYYSGFPLSPAVRKQFCVGKFMNGRLRMFETNVMPTGMTVSVSIATSATELLLDFPKRSKALSYIDNVIFVGRRADIVADFNVFAERVRIAGIQFNEEWSDVGDLIKSRGDWCGVALDFEERTVALTDKVMSKIRFSSARERSWTFRNFAAHMGALFYSMNILEVNVAEYFTLMRYVSTIGRMMQEDDSLWDKPMNLFMTMSPAAVREFGHWNQLCLANRPRRVTKTVPNDVEWVITTDASAYGYGYIAINRLTGAVLSHGEPWSPAIVNKYGDNLRKSNYSEPMGIVSAACRVLTGCCPTSVLFMTDNTCAKFSFDKGYSISYLINEAIYRLRKAFPPPFRFFFSHVPGKDNIADRLSRGGGMADEPETVVDAEMMMRWEQRALQALGENSSTV